MDEKRKQATLEKLFGRLVELDAQKRDVMDEMKALYAGGIGVAAQVKDLEEFFDWTWGTRYAGGQAGHYIWTYVRDKPQLKRMLKSLPPDEIKARMNSYLRNDDAFYVRARHSFGAFVASINSHAAPAQPAVIADVARTDRLLAGLGRRG